MIRDKELNTRQWKLYNLIKEYSLKNEWLSRRNIQKLLNDEYPIISEIVNVDSNARLITSDIQEINDSDVIQKVIISSSIGYKLLNDEEYLEFIKNEKIKILSRLKRYYKKVSKLNKHNQMKLTFTKHERDIVLSILEKE